jgi:hypothetical protein
LAVETLNEIGENYVELRKMKLNNFFDPRYDLEIATHTLISNHCIIMFCSFLDEYEKHFTPHFLNDVDSERILRVRNKNEPGLKRIKKWKDLKNFRNILAAHNFRVKGKSFFSEDIEKLKFVIPNKVSEKNLFLGISYLICMNIKAEFPEIFSSLKIGDTMIHKIEFISEEIDNESELEELTYKMLD